MAISANLITEPSQALNENGVECNQSLPIDTLGQVALLALIYACTSAQYGQWLARQADANTTRQAISVNQLASAHPLAAV